MIEIISSYEIYGINVGPPCHLPVASAEVRDGDGIRFGAKRIRLWGIDAPELDQECKRNGVTYRCGEQARDALTALLAKGSVRCEIMDRDRYSRTVSRCWVGSLDLGAEMVRLGWAGELALPFSGSQTYWLRRSRL